MPRSRFITYVFGAAIVLGTSVLTAWVLRPEPVLGPCAVASGPVTLPDVPETSGLAMGRRARDVVWSHNDSGNDAVLFAMNLAGTVRGRVSVPMRMRDWEDVSAGRCPAGDCLYLADIGDNGARRPHVAILRVPEPGLEDVTTPDPEVFTVSYPDGPHNAEGMFVVGADLFVITKDRTGRVYRARALAAGGGTQTMQYVGALGLATVTDAETSVDGRTVVVRTPREVAFYRTDALVTGKAAPYLRVDLTGLEELQGEGVALDGDVLHLSSEGNAWSPAGRLMALRCRLPGP